MYAIVWEGDEGIILIVNRSVFFPALLQGFCVIKKNTVVKDQAK